MTWPDLLSPVHAGPLVTAIACGVLCALLGIWLVLQRLSMLGDAISHAVLPGLVVAFLWFGTRAPVPMFLGAAAAGVLTTFLTRTISDTTRVKEDASMGVVFTVLFALGVVLITRYAAQIDLDAGCVLYGLLEFVGLSTFRWGPLEIPYALPPLLYALVATGAFWFAFDKELRLMAFDPQLAHTLGKRPTALYYGLMVLVSIATVASFEAVGSILVIAMLIGPPATAQLLTRRFGPMIAWSIGIAIVTTVAGYLSAIVLNLSAAGMIAVWVGIAYGLAVVASPEGGLVAVRMRHRARVRQIEDEDALAMLYRNMESGTPSQPLSPLVERRLACRGEIATGANGPRLTGAGLARARQLIRTHRLLESFLVEEIGKPPKEVHATAHATEHFLSPGETGALAASLDEPPIDPHGKAIPEDQV